MVDKAKIAYVTVGENLNADLLVRQVVGLLGDIKAKAEDLEITVFSFQGMLTIYNHKKDNAFTKERLKNLGISFFVIPNICPWPIPNLSFKKTDVGWRPNGTWKKVAVLFFQLLSLPLMVFLRVFCGYKLFHCRSYPATSIAIFLKKFIPDTAVLFDPRSDYPEENVTAGIWGYKSKTFCFWKDAEEKFLKEADAVACIGPTYVDHYKRNLESFNHFIAPNNVNCREFQRNLAHRKEIRTNFEITESERAYVYLGGMSNHGWHRPDFYLKFYDQLSKVTSNFKFIFLVPKHAAGIVADAFGSRKNVFIVSPELDEVGKYLSAADFGMMFFHCSKIAVGTKIGEYMAASLPVVVNRNCIGAVALIKTNQELGCVVDLGLGDLDLKYHFNEDDLSSQNKLLRSDDKICKFAKNYFDNERVADIYINQYRRLLDLV